MSSYLYKGYEEQSSPLEQLFNVPSIRNPLSTVGGTRSSNIYNENPNAFPDPLFTTTITDEAVTHHIIDGSDVQTPFANACIGVVDFVSKVAISHPCTVLRRQCQVHHLARSLHLTPFTFVPVVCNIISNEGIQTLWKGAVGSGLLWALLAASETLIAEFFGLPRNVVRCDKAKKFWSHVLLKASSYFAMTPFIVSSFIETVRSETGLSGDDFRVMDVITNGVYRLKSDFFMRDGSKRFSLFYLAIPTVTYQTTHYLIAHFTYGWIYQLARHHVNKKPISERTAFHRYLPDFFAMMSSQVIADFLCYPFETVLHRLYIQGTRTLIDNLDTGVSAISITAKYSGFVDCLQRILKQETAWAFYAGVGALGLQYFLNFSFLRFMRTAFDYGMHALGDNQEMTKFNPPPPLSPDRGDSSEYFKSLHYPSSTTSSEYPSFGQTSASLGRPSLANYPFDSSSTYSFHNF